jgi:hypothetical protein
VGNHQDGESRKQPRQRGCGRSSTSRRRTAAPASVTILPLHIRSGSTDDQSSRNAPYVACGGRLWTGRARVPRSADQLLLGGSGTSARALSPDRTSNHRNGAGKGSIEAAMFRRGPTRDRSTVRLLTGTIFREAAACAPGHGPSLEAAAERSPFVSRRPALTRRREAWDSSRMVGHSSVSFPVRRRCTIETVSSASPTENAMRGRQVGRLCRQRRRNKPLKGKPHGCHRFEIESEGLREERSVKGLRKPVGAAQPGEASPVLVASRCLKRRRGEKPHEGDCIAVVRRGSYSAAGRSSREDGTVRSRVEPKDNREDLRGQFARPRP